MQQRNTQGYNSRTWKFSLSSFESKLLVWWDREKRRFFAGGIEDWDRLIQLRVGEEMRGMWLCWSLLLGNWDPPLMSWESCRWVCEEERDCVYVVCIYIKVSVEWSLAGGCCEVTVLPFGKFGFWPGCPHVIFNK